MTKLFHLNSSNRDTSLYPSSSNFVLNFKNYIEAFNSITLKRYFIWNSSYLINQNNNTFTVTVLSPTYNIVLSQGNYTPDELATEIENKINAVLGSGTVTVSYNNSTLKFTINSSLAGTTYEFNQSLASILGFKNTIMTGTTITSDYVASTSLTPYYYLRIKEFGGSYGSNYESLCILPNNVLPGELATNDRPIEIPLTRTPIQTKTLTIELLDYLGNQVDLNGSNWICEFLVE